MLTRGSCVCGDVTYSFDEEPAAKVLCHCLTCRKLSGSSFATAFMLRDPDTAASPSSSPEAETASGSRAKESAPPSTFKIQSSSGTRLRETRALHSEAGLEMIFSGCANCPSTLYKRAPAGFPGMIIVLAGSLDASDEDGVGSRVRGAGGLEQWSGPQAELWVKYRLPWVTQVPGAKQCQMFE